MTIKSSTITRRRALAGAATVGLSAPLLAACGDDGDGAADDGGGGSPAEPSDAGSPSKQPSKQSSETAEADGIPTSDVPVGGGIIQDQVVVTQPTEGDFKAFTAVCTHAQCVVAEVTGGTINCPCHGSQFSIEDGSVATGPAPAPLAAIDLTVEGDRIVLG